MLRAWILLSIDSAVKFIKLTESDRSIYLALDEILFLQSKESQTEIFLKNRNESLTVKESLTEVIRNMKEAKAPSSVPPTDF